MNTVDYKKLRSSIRYTLLGMSYIDPRYEICLNALDVAENLHTGVRKDNTTPEFYHQLNIVGYLLTIHRHLIDPIAVYTTALLHDAYEDYPEERDNLAKRFPGYISYIVRISKERTSGKLPNHDYFNEMKDCPITSIVKGVDRIHNLSSMKGVFSEEKQDAYKAEVLKYFLPMLKHARRKFPEQTPAYENIKCVLNLYLDH